MKKITILVKNVPSKIGFRKGLFSFEALYKFKFFDFVANISKEFESKG